MATFGLAVERIHQLLGPVTVPGASQETFVRTIFWGGIQRYDTSVAVCRSAYNRFSFITLLKLFGALTTAVIQYVRYSP